MITWTFKEGLSYYLQAKKDVSQVLPTLINDALDSVYAGPVLMLLAAHDEQYKAKAAKHYESMNLQVALTEEESVFRMIFLMQYETKYNRMLGYPSLIEHIASNPSTSGVFTFGLIETLEAMDEMIYDEYRMLQATLKQIIDNATGVDAFKAYATRQAVKFRFLPKRYEVFAKSLADSTHPFEEILNQ